MTTGVIMTIKLSGPGVTASVHLTHKHTVVYTHWPNHNTDTHAHARTQETNKHTHINTNTRAHTHKLFNLISTLH